MTAVAAVVVPALPVVTGALVAGAAVVVVPGADVTADGGLLIRLKRP